MSTFAGRVERELRGPQGIVIGGSFVEWVLGACAAALAIIALSVEGTVAARVLMSLSVLCVASALLLLGGMIAGYVGSLLGQTRPEVRTPRLTGVLNAEFLAGCVGIVLGIIALIGYAPLTLTSAALILFGGAICLGGISRVISHFIGTKGVAEGEAASNRFVRESAVLSAAKYCLTGLSLIALGIIALYSAFPMTVNLVALLSVGGVLFLSGAMISGVMIGIFKEKLPYKPEEPGTQEVRHAA